MFVCPDEFALVFQIKFLTRGSALRAFRRRLLALRDITAYRTNPFFHDNFLLFNISI
jgi:hypothetical protein